MATEMSYLVFRITNMKFWGTSEAIISKTLQLLSDLSVGYPFERCLPIQVYTT